MARTKKVAARKRTAPKKKATRKRIDNRTFNSDESRTFSMLRSALLDHSRATAYGQVVGNAVMGFVVAGMNDPREIATQAIGIADAVVEVAEEKCKFDLRGVTVPKGDVIDITAGEGANADEDDDPFAEPETDIQ